MEWLLPVNWLKQFYIKMVAAYLTYFCNIQLDSVIIIVVCMNILLTLSEVAKSFKANLITVVILTTAIWGSSPTPVL